MRRRLVLATALVALIIILSRCASDRTLKSFFQQLAGRTAVVDLPPATAEAYAATAVAEQEDPSRVFSLGPGGGGAFDVFAFSPDYVFVGTDLGGVFRSHDHGQTWQTANRGLFDYMVNDIAVDPLDPSVIYLATPGGIYKSTNSGDSWTLLKNGFPAKDVARYSAEMGTVAVDPVDPKIIYAGTADIYADKIATGDGSLYKSTDGGNTWTEWNVEDPAAAFYKIVVDPLNNKNIYAATSTGFFRSADGGQNWNKVDNLQSRGLAAGIDRLHSKIILYRTAWTRGVYKSEDSGLTWQRLRGLHCSGGCYFYRIALDASDPGARKVYVGDYGDWHGDQGIFATSDGGLNWHQMNAIEEPGWVGSTQITRTRSLGLNPYSPRELYYGNSMGLFRTQDEAHWQQVYTVGLTASGGESSDWPGQWHERGSIDNTQANTKPMFSPVNHDEYYLAFSDIYIWGTANNGATWENVQLPGDNDIRALVADPNDSRFQTWYASSAAQQCCDGAVYWTTDGGKNWTQARGLPNDRVLDIAVSPHAPVQVFAATLSHGLFVSTDHGKSFRARNGLGEQSLPNSSVYQIAIDGRQAGRIYVALSGGGGGIFESHDAGMTWQKISNFADCYAISIAPSDSQGLYAGCTLNLYQSMDGGLNWTLLFDGRNHRLEPGSQPMTGYIRDIALHPTEPDVLCFVIKDDPYHDQASGGGLHCTLDGGATWKEIAGPLGLLYRGTAVAFHPLPDRVSGEHDLFYMTGGNGAYRIPFSLVVAVYKAAPAE